MIDSLADWVTDSEWLTVTLWLSDKVTVCLCLWFTILSSYPVNWSTDVKTKKNNVIIIQSVFFIPNLKKLYNYIIHLQYTVL